MHKRLPAAIAFLVAGASLATTAAAQGRGQGGPPAGAGGGAGAGTHSTLGMPSGSQRPSSPGAPSGAPGKDSHAVTRPATAAPLGPMSPISLLEQNSKLAFNLAGFFPDGTDLLAQSSGFKNLGQFVSAVHVSHNLGIPFDNLKCAELGTTAASASGTVCSSVVKNEEPMTLGQAIQTLRPDANLQQAVREANRQAEKDLQDAKSDGKS
jgi:hypothetical protein